MYTPFPALPRSSLSLPLFPPGLTKNVLSTVSPCPKTLGDGKTMV